MTSPLLALYMKRQKALVAELEGVRLPDAADKIRSMLRDLERPFSDGALTTEADTRLAHHALAMLAETVPIIAAVNATAVMPAQSRTAQPRSEGRRMGLLFLWLTALLNFAAVGVSIYMRDPNLDAIGFVLLALIAAVGAALVTSKKDNADPVLPAAEITTRVDARSVDTVVSRALRATDDLLAAATAPRLEETNSGPILNTPAVLGLLQGLVAQRMTSDPEDTAQDLARQAERLLLSAGVVCLDYSAAKAEFFDDRPAGISEVRTLRPALVDVQQRILVRGTVLVPAQ